MSFKNWLLDNQNLANQQANELEYNILIEIKIDEEKKRQKLRRSERIEKQRQEKKANEDYEAYLNSMKK